MTNTRSKQKFRVSIIIWLLRTHTKITNVLLFQTSPQCSGSLSGLNMSKYQEIAEIGRGGIFPCCRLPVPGGQVPAAPMKAATGTPYGRRCPLPSFQSLTLMSLGISQ